jgi:alpha-tubulin suppressor-like RCC1 family protein
MASRSPLPPSEVPLAFGDTVQLVAGNDFTCALNASGEVWCWGENDQGQLGRGGRAGTPPFSSTPTPVSGLTGATAIMAGPRHACALLEGDRLRCWGANGFRQLGFSGQDIVTEPVAMEGAHDITAVALGDSATCTTNGVGEVSCWGSVVPTPEPVVDLTNAVSVVAAARHSCALLTGGSVRCWGINSKGLLGDGSTTDSSHPREVPDITAAPCSKMEQLAAGAAIGSNSLVPTSRNKARCPYWFRCPDARNSRTLAAWRSQRMSVVRTGSGLKADVGNALPLLSDGLGSEPWPQTARRRQ